MSDAAPNGKLRITVVSLPALPAVDSSVAGPVGGTEMRAWTLCRGLAERPDVTVSLVVRGKPAGERTIDGVRVTAIAEPMYDSYVRVGRCVERTSRFPFVRVRQAEPSLLWRLPAVAFHRCVFGPPGGKRLKRHLRKPSADVLIVFGVTATSAAVLDVGRETGRPVVVGVGCDDDLDARYASDPLFVSPYGDRAVDCLRVLRGADAVLVQSDAQAAALSERFAREGIVLPNPLDREVWSPKVAPSPPDGVAPGYVLWVGRAEGIHKRPQLLPELAKRCRKRQFLMVMNPADAAVERSVRFGAPANVTIVPRVPPSEMPGVFAAAGCLVNTSRVEGFPNVFLQAAAVGLPVLSLKVMADWLDETGTGRSFGGDLGAMADALSEPGALNSRETRSTEWANRLLDRHDLRTVSAKFEEILRDTAAGETPGATR